MLSFIRSGRARKAMAAALAATFVLSVAGCGQKQQQGGNKAALVKTMKVIKRDTPLVYLCTGSAGNGAEGSGKRSDYSQVFQGR